MGGVEGEGFVAAGLAVAGFLNASDFVVNVIKDAASKSSLHFFNCVETVLSGNLLRAT